MGENISTGATVTRLHGFEIGKTGRGVESQGDVGWGVARREPTHDLIQVGGQWTVKPRRHA